MGHHPLKVFGIGLSKTGTTSLAAALRVLGYKTLHFPDPAALFDLMKTHDAATDTPVACAYPQLDELFPGSRFILTDRDFPAWMESAKHHFTSNPAATPAVRTIRMNIYHTPVWDEGLFAQAYWRHKCGVLTYFWRRPYDLLHLDISKGDGWGPLCDFLNVPWPDVAFPWSNRRQTNSHGPGPTKKRHPINCPDVSR